MFGTRKLKIWAEWRILCETSEQQSHSTQAEWSEGLSLQRVPSGRKVFIILRSETVECMKPFFFSFGTISFFNVLFWLCLFWFPPHCLSFKRCYSQASKLSGFTHELFYVLLQERLCFFDLITQVWPRVHLYLTEYLTVHFIRKQTTAGVKGFCLNSALLDSVFFYLQKFASSSNGPPVTLTGSLVHPTHRRLSLCSSLFAQSCHSKLQNP